MALFFFLTSPPHFSPRMTSNESVRRGVCVFVCVFVTFNYFQKKFLNSDKKVKPAKRSGDYYLSDQGCQCESLNEIMFVF